MPTIYDTPPDDAEGQEVIDNLVALSQTGRGVAAPPGLDEERLSALREGMTCATENEELIADMEAQQRPLDVIGGEEAAALVAEVLDSPESFQTLVRESY